MSAGHLVRTQRPGRPPWAAPMQATFSLPNPSSVIPETVRATQLFRHAGSGGARSRTPASLSAHACSLSLKAQGKARQTAPGLGAREEAVLPWPLPGGGRRGLDLPASPGGLRLPCREPQASDFSLRSRLVFLKDICLVCVYLTIPGFPVSLGLYSFSPGMESVLKSSDVKTASYPTLRRELAEPTDAPPPDSHALLHPRRPFAFTFPSS